MKNVYLLTWDPKNQSWDDYNDNCEKTKNGESVTKSWTCKSTEVSNGDEVYLIKTGTGIIAHGKVTEKAYEAPHFNEEWANEAQQFNYIYVEFDWITKSDYYIPIDVLTVLFPGQEWGSEISGVSIKDEYIEELVNMWNTVKKLSNKSIEIDFEKISSYLETYAGEKYVRPEKAGSKENEMLVFKENGQVAREEFDKFREIVPAFLPGYEADPCSKWINQGQIAFPYFWIEFKRRDARALPHSISVLLNLHPEHEPDGPMILSFRVEAKDTTCKEAEYQLHNRLIEVNLPPDSGIFYQVDLIPYRCENFGTDRDKVAKGIESGNIKKVKVAKNIYGPYEQTRTADLIMESVKAAVLMKPFYEHILKIRRIDAGVKEEIGMENNKKTGLNIILYGPPGTGKTYNTAIYAVSICEQLDLEIVKEMSYKNVIEKYKKLKAEDRVSFTTFHQSYGYEEFIEGIKPVLTSDDDGIGYKIESGVFKKFCETASENIENENKPYVFIIDEINRGNISKIFGELITLIEDTKRSGMDEEISAILPYSGEPFSVPPNVYILGTMNTADRSIALMDTALRRRFQFVEMLPDTKVLIDTGADKVGDIDVVRMLDTINERITYLYDREHTIGHAFFTKLGKTPDLETLGLIFRESVIPLLQEYFYEDYKKIQLVLGDNAKDNAEYKFILDEDLKVKDVFKGDPSDSMDMPEKKFMINEPAFSKSESYRQIY